MDGDPRLALRQPARAVLRAAKQREGVRGFGHMETADRTPSGAASGVVIGQLAQRGGRSVSPAVTFAWRLRSLIKPVNIPTTTVTNAAGETIGKIYVHPVTGKRWRVDCVTTTKEAS